MNNVSFFYDYAELIVLHEEITRAAAEKRQSFFDPMPEKYEKKISELTARIKEYQEHTEKFAFLAEKLGLRKKENGQIGGKTFYTYTRKEIAFYENDMEMECHIVEKEFNINEYLKTAYKDYSPNWKINVKMQLEKLEEV